MRMKTRRWELGRVDLAAEWSLKNGRFESYSIRDKVWWRCEKGHEWDAQIGHRLYRGQGCPFCAGQRATEETSLSVMSPDVSRLWHPTKNGELKPENTCYKSSKRIWWKCENGHEWCSRPSEESGCPYCAGRKPTPTENLSVLIPHVALEWSEKNKLDPSCFRPQSNKKAWWKCSKCGNEWESVISSRVRGRGCPVCSKLLSGVSFADVHPELIQEWSLKNGECQLHLIAPNSSKRVWWTCHRCGYEWKGTVASRNKSRGGCSRCFSAKEDHNVSLNKEVMKNWNWDKNKENPRWVSPASTRVFWWKCCRGHEWRSSVDSISRSRGCPFCHGRHSALELRVYSELKSIFPDAILRDRSNKVECDVWIPSLRFAVEVDGSYWHKGSIEKDKIKNDYLEKRGVRIIRLREYPLDKIGDNDVVFSFKELKNAISKVVSEIDSSKTYGYLQVIGFVNDSLFMDLMRNGKVSIGLDASHPELAKEWGEENNPLLPSDVSYGSSLMVWWRCKNGHLFKNSPNERSRGVGCPYCSGRQPTTDRNLAIVYPGLAEEWSEENNKHPSQVTPRSGKKFWWICRDCKTRWEATPNQRSRGYECCPTCYPKGYRGDRSGLINLILNGRVNAKVKT